VSLPFGTFNAARPPDVRFTPNSGHRLSHWDVRFVPKADITSRAMTGSSSTEPQYAASKRLFNIGISASCALGQDNSN
jgi:hypothetical protein